MRYIAPLVISTIFAFCARMSGEDASAPVAPPSPSVVTVEQEAAYAALYAEAQKSRDAYIVIAGHLDTVEKIHAADEASLRKDSSDLDALAGSFTGIMQRLDALVPAPPKGPPVFSVSGEVKDAGPGVIVMWGRAVPMNASANDTLGTVLDNGNIQVEKPDQQAPVGGYYVGDAVYLGQGVGKNALGGEVRIWRYGPAPKLEPALAAYSQKVQKTSSVVSDLGNRCVRGRAYIQKELDRRSDEPRVKQAAEDATARRKAREEADAAMRAAERAAADAAMAAADASAKRRALEEAEKAKRAGAAATSPASGAAPPTPGGSATTATSQP